MAFASQDGSGPNAGLHSPSVRDKVASLSALHVHSGWDCKDDAVEASRDLSGWGAPLAGVTDYRVYTRATMERMGLVKGVR